MRIGGRQQLLASYKKGIKSPPCLTVMSCTSRRRMPRIDTRFVSADDRQLAVAKASGFKIVDIRRKRTAEAATAHPQSA